MVAAMTGPTPKISVTVVPDARTAAASLFLVSRRLGVDAAQVVQEVGGELPAGDLNRSGRLGLLQDMSCLSCGYLLGDATGNQFAEHGVEPAGDLGPGPAQVVVALGPLPRYRGYADTGGGGAGGRG
jgi:hypothetical protein